MKAESTDAVSPSAQLPGLLRQFSTWATVEMLRGLLADERLLSMLESGATVEELAEATPLSARQAESMMLTLAVEDVVVERDGVWKLAGVGAVLEQLRGWLEMFLDGYGGYFRNVDRILAGDIDPSWRNMAAVGVSSVRISGYGALPLVADILDEQMPDARLVADFGCADAGYLVELCDRRPGLKGVGIEPAPALRQAALRLIESRGMTDRVRMVEGLDVLADEGEHPDVVVFGFVLHELLEQRGEPALVELLRGIRAAHPTTNLLPIEVDVSVRGDIERMRSDDHLRGYYNYYFWLHDFTNQRLVTTEKWRELFDAAGYRVLLERPIDPEFDPTGLEIGFLLEPVAPGE